MHTATYPWYRPILDEYKKKEEERKEKLRKFGDWKGLCEDTPVNEVLAKIFDEEQLKELAGRFHSENA
jgi:hypothetical protein